jgi:hypothetical protein
MKKVSGPQVVTTPEAADGLFRPGSLGFADTKTIGETGSY